MGLRDFYSVPSALPSQEGCADLIIDQDSHLLRTTAPSQLYAKSPYPLLAKVQHYITFMLNGRASSFAVSWTHDQSYKAGTSSKIKVLTK